MNCRNLSLPNLDKLEDMKEMIGNLGKRTDPAEIEELDKVVSFHPENIRGPGQRTEKKAASET